MATIVLVPGAGLGAWACHWPMITAPADTVRVLDAIGRRA
jgi:hypothetical protein